MKQKKIVPPLPWDTQKQNKCMLIHLKSRPLSPYGEKNTRMLIQLKLIHFRKKTKITMNDKHIRVYIRESVSPASVI